MKVLALLSTMLATGSLFAQADQCEWDPGPPTFGGTTVIADTPCFDVSPLTVVHLNSDLCECLADIRIVGSFQSCGTVFTTIGQPGGCETYSFDLQITGVSSTLGNFMGSHLSGTSTGQTPPVFVVDSQVVPCGDVFVFSVNSSCTCFREDTSRQLLTPPPPQQQAAPQFATAHAEQTQPAPAVLVTSTTTVVVCTHGAPNTEFSAFCVQDCDPLDPADPIIVEGQP